MMFKQTFAFLSFILTASCATFISVGSGNDTKDENARYPHIIGVTHTEISVNEIDIHVAQAGAGPLVLLLHGFPELWFSWRHQIPAIAGAGFFVVAPDLRGYGGSERPSETHEYDAMHLCNDIKGIIKYYGRNKAIVVGHDWGAAISAYCAQIAPEYFEALVTVSVPYGGPLAEIRPSDWMQEAFGDDFFYMRYFQTAAAQMELESRTAEYFQKLFVSPNAARTAPSIVSRNADAGGYLDRTGAPVEPPNWISPAEIGYFINTYERTGFRTALYYYRNLNRNWEILQNYNDNKMAGRALFIAGEHETFISGLEVDSIRSNLQTVTPNVDVVLVEDAGHWVMSEKPAAFNNILIAFLLGVKATVPAAKTTM